MSVVSIGGGSGPGASKEKIILYAVAALAAIVIGWIISNQVRALFKSVKALFKGEGAVAQDEAQTSRPTAGSTLSQAEIDDMARSIADAITWPLDFFTDEESIYEALRRLKNGADWNALSNAFYVKTKKPLVQELKWELPADQEAKAKQIIIDNTGVTPW